MGQTFFGYKPKDRLELHDLIFEIIWAGNGKWDFQTIYNMPLPMRRFWVNKINEKNNLLNNKNNGSTTSIAKPPAIKKNS